MVDTFTKFGEQPYLMIGFNNAAFDNYLLLRCMAITGRTASAHSIEKCNSKI